MVEPKDLSILYPKLVSRYEDLIRESNRLLSKIRKLQKGLIRVENSLLSERKLLVESMRAIREQRLVRAVHYCPVCACPVSFLDRVEGPQYAHTKDYRCPKCKTRFKVIMRREKNESKNQG